MKMIMKVKHLKIRDINTESTTTRIGRGTSHQSIALMINPGATRAMIQILWKLLKIHHNHHQNHIVLVVDLENHHLRMWKAYLLKKLTS
nr:unnamed protein product [Callosobruchus chinensis]